MGQWKKKENNSSRIVACMAHLFEGIGAEYHIASLAKWQTSNKKKYFTSLDSQCELGSAHNCLQHNKSCHLYALHPVTTTELVRPRIHEGGVLRMRR